MATITIKKEEYDNLKALTASIPAVAGQVIKLIEKNEQLRKENKNLKDIIEDMGGLDSDEEEQGLRTCYECGKTFQEPPENMAENWVSTKCPGCSGTEELPDSDDDEEEEEPNKCDKCGDESYKYSTELCEALGDGYYCHDCITNS